MNERNYQKVLDAIPHWQPTMKWRKFGVTAIQKILVDENGLPGIGFLDAYEIKQRLETEGKLPTEKEW